jgi:pimeloyl-ACP methyl ester carboxylesterase
VFLVGKDFGASPAYLFSILHPERVLGVITLGVPYAPPGPGPSMLHKYLPEGFYMLRWKVNLYIFLLVFYHKLYYHHGFVSVYMYMYVSGWIGLNQGLNHLVFIKKTMV